MKDASYSNTFSTTVKSCFRRKDDTADRLFSHLFAHWTFDKNTPESLGFRGVLNSILRQGHTAAGQAVHPGCKIDRHDPGQGLRIPDARHLAAAVHGQLGQSDIHRGDGQMGRGDIAQRGPAGRSARLL